MRPSLTKILTKTEPITLPKDFLSPVIAQQQRAFEILSKRHSLSYVDEPS